MKKQKNENSVLVPQEVIEKKIFLIRGKKVMIDRDLATLYGVKTKVLNQAVKRNKKRFPEIFMFQLNKKEFQNWKSQFVTSNRDKKGLRKTPYAFTEQGVAMLSSVLNSERAIQINIQIMMTFTKVKQMLLDNNQIKILIRNLEYKFKNHDFIIKEHDNQIHVLGELIKQILEIPEKSKKKIGFV